MTIQIFFDWVVVDQLKEMLMLPRNTLQSIFLKEGTEILSASEISDLADLYDKTGLGRVMQDKHLSAMTITDQIHLASRMHLNLRKSETADFSNFPIRLQTFQNEKGNWSQEVVAWTDVRFIGLHDIPTNSAKDNRHVVAIFVRTLETLLPRLRKEQRKKMDCKSLRD